MSHTSRCSNPQMGTYICTYEQKADTHRKANRRTDRATDGQADKCDRRRENDRKREAVREATSNHTEKAEGRWRQTQTPRDGAGKTVEDRPRRQKHAEANAQTNARTNERTDVHKERPTGGQTKKQRKHLH